MPSKTKTKQKKCHCRCGYRCGGPGVCKLTLSQCLGLERGHFVRDCGHNFVGKLVEIDGGMSCSLVCTECGMTALAHDERCGP